MRKIHLVIKYSFNLANGKRWLGKERGSCGVHKPLGCAHRALDQEPVGTACPGPQQHAHAHFAQILSQRFIENWNCGTQGYICMGKVGFYGEHCARVTFFAYDALNTGSRTSWTNPSPPQTALVSQLKYKVTHWDRWTKTESNYWPSSKKKKPKTNQWNVTKSISVLLPTWAATGEGLILWFIFFFILKTSWKN